MSSVNSDPLLMTRWGAYGFAIEGFREPEHFLGAVEGSWPALSCLRTQATEAPGRPAGRAVGDFVFGVDRAEIWMSDTDRISVDRSTLEIRYETKNPLSDDLLAHPYLGLPAGAAARWLGRQVLHGGAFVHGGHAWGVLGTKEAGKSSTMAWLDGRDVAVLTDDLLIIEGQTVFAGPRTIDLRSEAAAAIGGEHVLIQGVRDRWRIRPGPGLSSASLGGFVILEWGASVHLEPVPASRRMAVFIENALFAPDMSDATAYLDLSSLPMWRFERPRDLDMLDHTMRQLLDALA